MKLKYLKVRPHGTRSCYVGGCRCDRCRAANTAYYHSNKKRVAAALASRPRGPFPGPCPGVDEQGCPSKKKLRMETQNAGLCKDCQRRAAFNGLVPVEKSLTHILALAKRGVGYRQVAAVSKVSPSVLARIKSGVARHVCVSTERRILAVTEKDLAGAAYVPASETWRLINILRYKYGFSKAELADEMGYDTHALQLNKKRILKRNADEVKKLYDTLMEERRQTERAVGLCNSCGLSHEKSARLRVLKRMLPCMVREIVDAYPCLYMAKEPGDYHSNENRMLYRDLQELGAVRGPLSEWFIPRPNPEARAG